MPQGLPRRIKLAFVLQALIGSIVITLGMALSGMLVHQSLTRTRVDREAAAFWSDGVNDPVNRLPRSSVLRGYFDPAGAAASSAPIEVRGLPNGYHALDTDTDRGTGAGRDRAYVERRPAGTLYLVFSTGVLGPAILWTCLLGGALSLLTMYLLSWLTYRTSKRLVTPVSWLAGVVSRWDPRAPDVAAIAPVRLPVEAGSEVRELARSLTGLAQRVGDFVQRERDFTRDASHELRTPLTVIRVATDLMQGDPDIGPRAQRSLARVQRAGSDMESVIDAFLILAREAEVAPLTEEFEVRDVVGDEVERLQPLLAGKPVQVEVVDEGAPRLVAPPRVLHVMLGNLLSNAAHFTESGRIVLHLHPDRIEVRDTGIGMAPETLSRAFDPFYRAGMADRGGRGMGLSIVRRLGERFGWPVVLDSIEGKGTTAVIHLSASLAPA